MAPVTHLLRDVARPPGGFGLLYIDAPWRFEAYSGASVPQRAVEQHYETMSFDELAQLPLVDLAARDSCLAMWVISSHLDQGIRLGETLGFAYKTLLFVWTKGRMGLGKWTRQEAEICLLFTRGRPRRQPGAGGVRQHLHERPREHSRKPDEFARRLEVLCAGPRLELFARGGRPGWSTWGDQSDRYAAAAE